MDANSPEPWDPGFEDLIRTYLLGVPMARPLALDLDMRAYGLNSSSLFGLLADIEEKYGLKIPAKLLTFETFQTPGALWAAVKETEALQFGQPGAYEDTKRMQD
ncbi:MAG TPA: acyl carrier protein [Trebonia sp.]|jgi:acyl carrier protein|nr:acyl carrier protein [Trebonia sp.]